jgi:hypothetical protein
MSADFYVKVGDTLPVLGATLYNADGTTLDLAGATVTFHMTRRGATEPSVSGACTVTDEENGGVEYAWQADDLEVAGRYNGEFQVVFGTGEIVTIPNDGYLWIEVTDELD